MFGKLFSNASHSNKKRSTLDAEAFRKALDVDSSHQLIDVRSAAERKEFMLSGAIGMEWGSSEFDIHQLDSTKPVFIYCRSGMRSKRAANHLANKGFEVYDLRGGIMNWNY